MTARSNCSFVLENHKRLRKRTSNCKFVKKKKKTQKLAAVKRVSEMLESWQFYQNWMAFFSMKEEQSTTVKAALGGKDLFTFLLTSFEESLKKNPGAVRLVTEW